MPFVSDAQRRKCYALQRQMNQQGMVSTWDCKEFEKGSAKKTPKKVTSSKKSPKTIKDKSPKKSPKKLKVKFKGEQVFKGIRGGKYVMRNNRKVYI
jgi:hypothetical protein